MWFCFWFDGGLMVVAFFFFSYLLWPMLEVEGEREKGKERERERVKNNNKKE